MKKLLLAFIFMILIPIRSFTQDSDLGNWIIYFGNKQINEKWNWHHELQYRNFDAIGDLEQLLIRTGIGYNLTENNNNVLFGYGYILSQNYVNAEDKVDIQEHRIFQQFISRQRIGRVSVQHRYRFEQRWIEDDFRLRFRYFLSLNIPLNHAQLIDRTFYLSTYDEIFLNSDKVIFDRNRLYGGLGYRLNGVLRFELGYMNQFLNESGRDQINMITFFNF